MTYSSKLSSHYLELAEQPISKDVFAGEDVRFSSEYEALENELGKALSLHENGQTDWLKILKTVKRCFVPNPRTCVLQPG